MKMQALTSLPVSKRQSLIVVEKNPNISFTSLEADKFESTTKPLKKEASKAEKLAVGAASLFVPGLGQLFNGESKKAIKYFIREPLLCASSSLLATGLAYALSPIVAIPIGIIAGITTLVLHVQNVADAVKNA